MPRGRELCEAHCVLDSVHFNLICSPCFRLLRLERHVRLCARCRQQLRRMRHEPRPEMHPRHRQHRLRVPPQSGEEQRVQRAPLLLRKALLLKRGLGDAVEVAWSSKGRVRVAQEGDELLDPAACGERRAVSGTERGRSEGESAGCSRNSRRESDKTTEQTIETPSLTGHSGHGGPVTGHDEEHATDPLS